MGTVTKEQRQSVSTPETEEEPEIGLFTQFLRALAPPDEWVAAQSQRK